MRAWVRVCWGVRTMQLAAVLFCRYAHTPASSLGNGKLTSGHTSHNLQRP